MRTAWWTVTAALALTAGCAGDRRPLPIEPAWTSCATEASGPPGTTEDLPRLDDSFQPVAAVICGHPPLPPSGRGVITADDEHRTTDVTALVAALRLPDEPRTADACTLALYRPPFIALLDRQGRWVRPGLPTNVCGQVRQEVRDALERLQPAPTVTPTEDESAAAGCTRQWADMVGATVGTASTAEPAVIPPGFDGPVPVRLCVYRVPQDQQGTGKPAGDLRTGRYLSDEQWAAARRDIEAAAPAGPCSGPASRFAVLHLATGQIHVELDGCRRLLAQAADGGGTVRQAVPALVDLLARRQARPPPARMFWPVIHRPSGPARKPTTSAMSAGSPSRPSGVVAEMRASASGGLVERSRSVSVAPGDTVLTVMPRGPSSLAATAANCSVAPLLPT